MEILTSQQGFAPLTVYVWWALPEAHLEPAGEHHFGKGQGCPDRPAHQEICFSFP